MDYNPGVIETIENECKSYVKRFRRMPQTINVSKYEYEEFKKASREGVHPTIVFKKKKTIVSVSCQ